MKAVFRQYGLTMITCIVGLLCFLIVGYILQTESKKIWNVHGVEQMPARAMESFQFGGVMRMRKMERTISVGEKIAVNDFFKVWDSQGNPGQIAVTAVQRVEGTGEEETILQENGTQYFCFRNPGIYTLSLEISMARRQSQSLEVDIPVKKM